MEASLRFTVHQVLLRADGRFYLPLPKLNHPQQDAIATRLTRLGFRLRRGERLKAYSSSGFIHLDDSGIASSNKDLLDPLAPLIPELLEAKKERIPLEELASMYYTAKRAGGRLHLRLSVRGESLGLWRKLRAGGESLLTPDEAAVLRGFLKGGRGRVKVITDYPKEGSKIKQIGGRLYYLSEVDPDEFASNLRTVEGPGRRNAYLPSNPNLTLERSTLPPKAEMIELLNGLGEWCFFFTPK